MMWVESPAPTECLYLTFARASQSKKSSEFQLVSWKTPKSYLKAPPYLFMWLHAVKKNKTIAEHRLALVTCHAVETVMSVPGDTVSSKWEERERVRS